MMRRRKNDKWKKEKRERRDLDTYTRTPRPTHTHTHFSPWTWANIWIGSTKSPSQLRPAAQTCLNEWKSCNEYEWAEGYADERFVCVACCKIVTHTVIPTHSHSLTNTYTQIQSLRHKPINTLGDTHPQSFLPEYLILITHTHTYTHTHTHTHTYTQTHTHTHTHTHAYTHTHTHTHTYTQTHTRTYTHTHIHTYTHAHIHTYTHTHRWQCFW